MKIIKRQLNSKMCFICGLDNPVGLRAPFYTMEDGSVMTQFQYKSEHQSFPLRVHGGLIATMLDELAMRAYWVENETGLGVTLSLETKFRKPVPYDTQLFGRGIITKETSRMFVAETQIFDNTGLLLANGTANYIKLPAEKIAEDASFHEEMCYLIEDNLTELDFQGLKS